MAEKKLLMTQVYDGHSPPSFPMKGSENVSLTSASAQSAAIEGDIALVSADVDFTIAWGPNPTATTSVGDGKAFCKSTEWTEVHIDDGDKIAGVLGSGIGTMYVRFPKTQELG